MCLRIEEDVPLHAASSGHFNLQRVSAAHFGEASKTDADLVFPGVDEMRIVVLPSRLELAALRAGQRGELTIRAAAPRGLAVVRLDQSGVTCDEFGVITIRQLRVERVSSGLALGRAEGPFNRDCSGLRKRFGATRRLDVLLDELLRVLRGCSRGKKAQTKCGC